MWDLLWNALIFISGIAVGRAQLTNVDFQDEFARLQDVIQQEHERTANMKQMWLDAEEQAETWKRRYNYLLSEQKGK